MQFALFVGYACDCISVIIDHRCTPKTLLRAMPLRALEGFFDGEAGRRLAVWPLIRGAPSRVSALAKGMRMRDALSLGQPFWISAAPGRASPSYTNTCIREATQDHSQLGWSRPPASSSSVISRGSNAMQYRGLRASPAPPLPTGQIQQAGSNSGPFKSGGKVIANVSANPAGEPMLPVHGEV